VVSSFFGGLWRLGNRYKIFSFLEGWGFNLSSLNFWKTLLFFGLFFLKGWDAWYKYFILFLGMIGAGI